MTISEIKNQYEDIINDLIDKNKKLKDTVKDLKERLRQYEK